jgi:PIN domain nuclease of toxin-antitoxin system
MRVLIDTHIFIWYIQNSERLPSSIATYINDGRNDILLMGINIMCQDR